MVYLLDNDGAIPPRHVPGKANGVVSVARLLLLRHQVILEGGLLDVRIFWWKETMATG